ncbi:MAG: hypothetical protein ACYC2D_02655 [Thiobacillus sp.]
MTKTNAACLGQFHIAHGSSANFFRVALSDVLMFIARRQASIEVHHEKNTPLHPAQCMGSGAAMSFRATAQAASDFGAGS